MAKGTHSEAYSGGPPNGYDYIVWTLLGIALAGLTVHELALYWAYVGLAH